jgi:transposase
VIIVSDKGFYSDENITALLHKKIHFAIPLKRNSKLIDQSLLQHGDKTGFHGHFFYSNRPIWYVSHRIRKAGRYCYILTFLDESLYLEEQNDYLQRVQLGKEGYTMEAFFEQQYKFGTLSIIAFLPRGTTPQQVFEYFKARNAVEQMIDVFKNTLQADRSYMRTEQQMEGWMFLNHLALMLYYQIYKELAGLNLLSKYSPLEVLQYLERIYKVRVNAQWHTSEIPKKTKVLVDKLALPIP